MSLSTSRLAAHQHSAKQRSSVIDGSMLLIARLSVFLATLALATLAGLFTDRVPTQSIIVQVVLIAIMLSMPLGKWLVGHVNTLDPISLMCMFGLHYFIYGPIYQISLDYWPFLPWTARTDAYIPVWYWINAIFLGLSLFSANIYERNTVLGRDEREPLNIASTNAVRQKLLMIVLFTLALKVLTFAIFGGVSGVISAYQSRLDGGGVSEANSFGGIGPIVSIGNAFPIAFGYLLVHLQGRRGRDTSLYRFTFYGVTVSILAFSVNGLMGSRAYVIYALLMTLGLYHFRIRTLRKRDILLSIIALFAFSQVYYAFKFGGIVGLLDSAAQSSQLEARQIDDLGDFGLIRDYTRMDVQTFSIYSVQQGQTELSWGRSYIGGLAAIIPQAIWPNRIDSFTKEKSQIMYNASAPNRRSNLVFGGLGEAYVNFGMLSLILSVPFGIMLGKMRMLVDKGMYNEITAQYTPLYALLPIMLLMYDSNSLLYVMIMVVVTPLGFTLVLARAKRHRPLLRSGQRAAEHHVAET